ncbi:hypothetical protein Ocin01_00421 [Orchesella cincta]|uniref:Uncharacterized protein n=1 Tax=Orchesella cincta TaxID=48709 RepID=A0A1D2NLT2_ORCCI|nr:hypothetical protein Ocin01_00421 [Orchesella cincta]
MSVTELQVIHRHVKPTPTSNNRFLLPNGGDQEDTGLVMKLDSKLKEKIMLGQPTTTTSSPVVSMQNPSAVRPSAVSSQLCGQSHEVTGWVLRGALILQTAHIPFIKLTHKMNDTIQKKTKLLLPIVLYMSLLVLVAQAGAVVMLFYQSFMPIGMWFLLCCIAILAAMFCYTAVLSNNQSQSKASRFILQ